MEPAEFGDRSIVRRAPWRWRRRPSATTWANSGSTAAIVGRVIAFGLVVGAARMPRRHEPPRPRGARSRLQVMSTRHLDDLRVQARYARERYDLYKAKAYGPRPTSPARLRELQRECERAEARLRAAQAEERRVRITDDTTPNPS